METMTDSYIKKVYVHIAAGEGLPHGSFITNFSRAILHADPENFQILRPAALEIMLKYDLAREVEQP